MGAAAELFAEYGVEATSVAQLSKRAEVSTSTFFNLFGSKSRLAVALFDRHAELHFAARRGLFDSGDAVLDYAMGVADLAASHPDLATVFLAEFVSDKSGEVGASLLDPMVELLTSTSLSGVTGSDGDVRDRAQIMVMVAIQRTLRRPALGIESAARWATQLLPFDANT